MKIINPLNLLMEAGAEVHGIYNTILLIQLPMTVLQLIHCYYFRLGAVSMNGGWIDWVNSLQSVTQARWLPFFLMSLTLSLVGTISFAIQLIFMYEWIHKREVQFSHTLNLFQQRVQQIFLAQGISFIASIGCLIIFVIIVLLANFFGFNSVFILQIVGLLASSYLRFTLYPSIVEGKNSWEGFIQGIQVSQMNFLSVIVAYVPLVIFRYLSMLLFEWISIIYPPALDVICFFNVTTNFFIAPLVGMYFLLLYLRLKPGSSLSLQG